MVGSNEPGDRTTTGSRFMSTNMRKLVASTNMRPISLAVDTDEYLDGNGLPPEGETLSRHGGLHSRELPCRGVITPRPRLAQVAYGSHRTERGEQRGVGGHGHGAVRGGDHQGLRGEAQVAR